MKNLCIIPIRSGSKGIKNKNIKKLINKPLVCYAIDESLKCNIFESIVIATDSSFYIKKIKSIYKNNKKVLFFKRSKISSTSTAATSVVIKEVLKNFVIFDNIFLIQATSPLIKSTDIKSAYSLFLKKSYESLFSSYPTTKFFWEKKTKTMQSINYDYKKRLPRQKLKKQYVENGAIYIFKLNLFKKFRNVLFGRIGTYIMEEDRSIDIDDKKDFQKAKNYLISNMS